MKLCVLLDYYCIRTLDLFICSLYVLYLEINLFYLKIDVVTTFLMDITVDSRFHFVVFSLIRHKSDLEGL